MAVIPALNGSSITVVFVDSGDIYFLDTDETGLVLSEHHLPLAINTFTHLDGFRKGNGEMVLLFDMGDLEEKTLSPDRLHLSRHRIASDIQGFEADGSRLVYFDRNRMHLRNGESGAE